MINIKDLTFEYFSRDEDNYLEDMIVAIENINFNAQDGEFIVIAGRNGSGKSTFARILNRLLVPIEGNVEIFGYDALDIDNVYEIRKKVGMVFQNPDDQIIGSIVEEEIAFGMENLGFDNKTMKNNVVRSLNKVGFIKEDNNKSNTIKDKNIASILKKRVSELSGGEKQKLVIAGVLAMNTKCIVLDESTSMLDPKSRSEIIKILLDLKKQGITIILITHIMEELLYADTIYIFDKGKISLKGRRNRIFSDEKELNKFGLEQPMIVKIVNELFSKKIINNHELYTIDDLTTYLYKEYPYAFVKDIKFNGKIKEEKKINMKNAILFDKISFSYNKKKYISDLSFGIAKGEFVAIVGNTGAGKTTITQMIPGLVKPQKGTVYIDGVDVFDKNTVRSEINKKVGYLFQYPEQQLFSKNVFEDVVFGPRNLGISEVEAEKRAYESIELVGLPQDVYDLPMNRLSGGQRRRVALAGVLAMKPEYLILDEPTAGLDPEGRNEMMAILKLLHEEAGMTIIMISHDLDVISNVVDRIIVVDNGDIIEEGSPAKALYNSFLMTGNYEGIPTVMRVLVALRKMGLEVKCDCVTVQQLVSSIKEAL